MTRRTAILVMAGALGAGCAGAPPAPEPEPAPPVPCCEPPAAELVPVPDPYWEEPEPLKPERPQVEPRLVPILAQLGITAEIIATKRLYAVPEAEQLVVAEVGADGRRHLLEPEAAYAWHAMQAAAADAGIIITIVSAYRSIDRQIAIVQGKLERGETIEEILQVSAPPGFSEHHSGRVVDIGTPASRALHGDFADTPAYRWLESNAARFGFVLSFPKDNPEGYMFEPWHWRFDGH